MRQLTELEIQKAQILKAARSAIRLKHSLAADHELNARLPELEREVDVAIQRGEAYELDVASLLSE